VGFVFGVGWEEKGEKGPEVPFQGEFSFSSGDTLLERCQVFKSPPTGEKLSTTAKSRED